MLCAGYTIHTAAATGGAAAAATGAIAASLLSQRFILDCMCSMFAPYINYIGGLFIKVSQMCARVFVCAYVCVCGVAERSSSSSSRGVRSTSLF